MSAVPVRFASPLFLAIALLVAIAIALLVGTRPRRRRRSALLIAGLLCVTLAAGEPTWLRPRPHTIAVMVDLSSSTRGAAFRDPGLLTFRLHELLGKQPFTLLGFADGNQPITLGPPMPEMPSRQTVFASPVCDAVVLFSDCQFVVPPAAPPTYIVVDPMLETIADASVQQLKLRGSNLAATILNTGTPRTATMEGIIGDNKVTVPTGRIVITRHIDPRATLATVRLDAADPWPENDAMALNLAPPLASQSWWIGDRDPGPPWRYLKPANLPDDPASYLAPSIIVLDNLSAADLLPAAMDRLAQYVRDLGGSLLILGGDRAFAAGMYAGTELETLSPLSSLPTEPQTRWVLLADASGSMSEAAGAGTRFSTAAAAISALIPRLPPADPVEVGQFSDTIKWWTTGQTASQAAALTLPPPDAGPHGPTNLQPALQAIADSAQPGLPTQLLLLSDCDAQIDAPADLSRLLQSKKIQLRVVAIGHGSGLAAIQSIADSTGGGVIESIDPAQWTESARQLARAAIPSQLDHNEITAHFTITGQTLAPINIPQWNHAWLKPAATAWTVGPSPLAAEWHVGHGDVVALAFAPAIPLANQLADILRQHPADPRYAITWQTSPTLRVTVNAIDAGRFLNGLKFTLDLDGSATDLEQTAPGQYDATTPAPTHPTFATLLAGPRLLDRIPLPGRFPPEFDALGNDYLAMSRLATQTGGAVIPPTIHAPLDFHWPPDEPLSLTSWLAALGVLLLAVWLAEFR